MSVYAQMIVHLVCVYDCVCRISVCTHGCLYRGVCASACTHSCVSGRVYWSVYAHVCVSLSVCVYSWLCVHLTVCRSVCISVCTWMSVHVSVCVSVHTQLYVVGRVLISVCLHVSVCVCNTYTIISWWAFRLSPCLDYCDGGAMTIEVHVSFQIRTLILLGIYAQE